MDIFFIGAMMTSLAAAMIQRGTWRPLNGIGDFIAWFMVCAFGLTIFRFPVYLYLYGWRFPFNPSDTVHFVTSVCAVFFWWAMVFWQVPGRIFRLFRKG